MGTYVLRGAVMGVITLIQPPSKRFINKKMWYKIKFTQKKLIYLIPIIIENPVQSKFIFSIFTIPFSENLI